MRAFFSDAAFAHFLCRLDINTTFYYILHGLLIAGLISIELLKKNELFVVLLAVSLGGELGELIKVVLKFLKRDHFLRWLFGREEIEKVFGAVNLDIFLWEINCKISSTTSYPWSNQWEKKENSFISAKQKQKQKTWKKISHHNKTHFQQEIIEKDFVRMTIQ